MNCEEYVVTSLQELKSDNARLKSNIEHVTMESLNYKKSLEHLQQEFETFKSLIKKKISLKTSSLNSKYIDFESFWYREWNDAKEKEEFELMCKFLGVKLEDFEPYMEPETKVIEEQEEEDGE